MAGADIALRVSTTGADEARAKLALVGETGTQALTRINAASSEASGGMEAFSTAIQRTSGAAQQLDIARQMLLNIETAAQRVAAAQQKINDLTGGGQSALVPARPSACRPQPATRCSAA